MPELVEVLDRAQIQQQASAPGVLQKAGVNRGRIRAVDLAGHTRGDSLVRGLELKSIDLAGHGVARSGACRDRVTIVPSRSVLTATSSVSASISR